MKDDGKDDTTEIIKKKMPDNMFPMTIFVDGKSLARNKEFETDKKRLRRYGKHWALERYSETEDKPPTHRLWRSASPEEMGDAHIFDLIKNSELKGEIIKKSY